LKNSKVDDFRKKLHTIIYEADTPAGKFFDLSLLVIILISVLAVMLESVASIKIKHGHALAVVEWVVTIFFTIEYIARLIAVNKPFRYIFSFYGIVDLLATIPKYIGLLFPGTGVFIAIRAIRLLRIFRILKLAHFVGASNQLVIALKTSRAKIAVFLFSVVVLCIILGTFMYMIEGPEHGFTSIPVSIYWTVVTLTTVGFGDITPETPFGQFVSSLIMILGYGIIAVPTGLVTAELMREKTVNLNTQVCPNCGADKHRDDAEFCYNCGHHLNT
jgi:voltage-gated potassium channel